MNSDLESIKAQCEGLLQTVELIAELPDKWEVYHGGKALKIKVNTRAELRQVRAFLRTAFGSWNDKLTDSVHLYNTQCCVTYTSREQPGVMISFYFDIESAENPLPESCHLKDEEPWTSRRIVCDVT